MKYTPIYLRILPIDTKSKNGKKEYFKVPATNVIGSPINGTQPNKSDHFPYLLNIFWLLSNWFEFTGNHFLLWKIKIFFPRYQFTIEPQIFPKLAKKSNSPNSYFFDKIITDKKISEEKGRIVAAKKLIITKLA